MNKNYQIKNIVCKTEVRPLYKTLAVLALSILIFFTFASSSALAVESTFTTSLTTTGLSILPPPVPVNLNASAVSDTQIDLSWSASTPNYYPIAGYRIFRDSVILATTSSTIYSDTGLTQLTGYSYTVEAFDSLFQMSGRSATSTATTTATPLPSPSPTTGGGGSSGGIGTRIIISNVKIIPGTDQAEISFTTNVQTQTKVQWGFSGDYEIGSLQNLFYGFAHTQIINGLVQGLTYKVRITANDSNGATVYKDVEFTTVLPITELGPLSNPTDFLATAKEKEIELSWKNPTDSRFNDVRIVRTEGFYPIDEFDGIPLYEGDGESFVDTTALPGVTYYYAIFSRDRDMEYSSGALAQARIAIPGEPVVAAITDPFANLPQAKDVDPMIKALTLADFEFIQDGKILEVVGETVAISGDKNLTIRLRYNKVPEILKTVAFTLQDPNDKSKVFPFLLRVNNDKTYYEATIGALGRSGRYGMSVVILDYQNNGLMRLNGTLAALAFTAPLFDFGKNFDLFGLLILLLVILLLILAIMLLRKLVQYSTENKKSKYLTPAKVTAHKIEHCHSRESGNPCDSIKVDPRLRGDDSAVRLYKSDITQSGEMLLAKLGTPSVVNVSMKKFIVSVFLIAFAQLFIFNFVSKTTVALAAYNQEINYQGKLVTSTSSIVPDGNYNIRFKLYTSRTGGSPIWTETWCNTSDCAGTGTGTDDRIAISNGLFSTMLGSTTALTGIDFNQSLYLGVEIGGSGATAVWDGEMSPRKILGAVPAAFYAGTSTVALSANKLSGLNAEQFFRTDAQNATSSASTFLNVLQTGAGKIAEFFGSASQSVLALLSNGNVGIGTSTPSSKLSLVGGNFTHTASSSPTLAGTYDTSNFARNVYISGKYAYVADDVSGLHIIDISNPVNPILIGTYDTGGAALGVFVSGKYAYVADATAGIQIIDISNPISPTLAGTYNTSGSASGIYISGKYAYVADFASGLQIIDISNPVNPTLTGTYVTSDWAQGVYVSGKYAYVAVFNAGLQIIDISNPSSPILAGTYNTSGTAYKVYTSGKYAYVADDTSGLHIIDISNPSSPILAGTYNTSGRAYGIYFSGKYAYVADGSAGIQVVDISSSTAPLLVGTYDTSGDSRGVYVSGKYAYVADGASGLQIIDINGIETPSLYAGNIGTNDLTVTENIDVGNNLYVRNGLNVGNGGIFTDGVLSVAGTSSSYFGGNLGLGTTSPNWKLSVAGIGSFDDYVRAGYFTATSTTASTFPYASTTALTVSGTNGLQLASGLNGPLQANNGLVSATTSVGVLYGGTGLSTAPSYGQLLLGNASSGYTLTSTSSLGISLSSIIGNFGNSWELSNNIFSESSLTSTTTQNIAISGIGTSTFAGGLEAWRQIASPYFHATSTTATSTFAGGLNVAGTSGLTVLQNGNVGLGTTSPASKLHVWGTFQVGTSTTPTMTVDTAMNKVGIGVAPSSSYSLYVNGATNIVGSIYATSFIDRATTQYFLDPGSSGTSLSVAGYVGIGTTSPYAKLSVVGQVVGEYFTATSTTATSTFPNLSITNLLFGSDYLTDITGSGLTISNNALTVTGASILGAANMLASFDSSGNLTSTSSPQVAYINATSTTATSTFAGGMSVAGASGLTVLQNGSVGIGTINPGSKLEVVGDIISKGTSWTARSAAGNNDTWSSVAYGNGLFVAIGYSGDRVMTSPDGINWTARSAVGNNDGWIDITYGNGLFVVVGNDGDRVITSPDGINWTARSALGNDDNWTSVTYGNGLFVAVAASLFSDNFVMTSPDGINWTARSAAGNDDNWTSTTYDNGLFVAVGNSGDRVITSPDGINWTAQSAAGNNDSWYSITYSNGLFVAVGGSGDRVMTSPDGINWTAQSAAGDNDSWYSITYGNGLFVAVGGSGDRVMTSPDGINWTARSAAGDNDIWYGVTYGNGLFVAVGDTGDRVMTSGKIEQTQLAHNNTYQGGMNIFGNLGLATTSPWRTLSVNGSSDLGTNALAGYFTATSTTASTFPYASTTALTVSGTNGLQLATGLNGLLQANNGLVSATTSVGVLYGGTGLSTAPTYGQLLLGNASSGYTLTSTSSLGISLSSIIGNFGKSWELTNNIFSQSSLSPTTTQNIAITGTGTSTFAGGLEAWRQIASPYFHATSTIATSTFAGGLSVAGGMSVAGAGGISVFPNGAFKVGLCVTGDTKLRRRRRKKKTAKGKNSGKEDLSIKLGVNDYTYDEVMIKDVLAGDEIQTLDTRTGKLVWSKVKQLAYMGSKPIFKLTTESGKTISTTGNHPYFVREKNTDLPVKKPRLGIFYDNSNMYYAQKNAGWKIDIKRLREQLSTDFDVKFINLYSALPEENDSSFKDHVAYLKAVEPFVTLKTKPLKYIKTKEMIGGKIVENIMKKGDVDAEIVLDATRTIDDLDVVMIVSGDSDYLLLNDFVVKEKGKRIIFAGFEDNMAWELRQIKHVYFNRVKNLISTNISKDEGKKQAPSFGLGVLLTRLLYSRRPSVSSGGMWTKVTDLKSGYEIAVSQNNKSSWDKIVNIESLPSEDVYDIEVEGTHNFIGNGIVAHNTAFMVDSNSNVGVGTTSPNWKLSVVGIGSFDDYVRASYFTATSTTATSTFPNLSLTRILFGSDYLTDITGSGLTISNNALTVTGASILGAANMLASFDSSGNLTSTSSPQVAYINATSTTNKSYFTGGVNISGITGGYYIDNGLILQASSTNQSTLVGDGAGVSLLADGLYNTALGYQALNVSTSSDSNTAVGYHALKSNTTGAENSAYGMRTLYSNTTGNYNSAQGVQSLYLNTIGSGNSSQGYGSLYSNTTGSNNSALGMQSLYYNITGSNNTAVGYNAGVGTSAYSNQGGVYLGHGAGYSVSTGSDYNTIIGFNSGYSLTTGSYNILIGQNVQATSTNSVGGLNIGNVLFGVGMYTGISLSGTPTNNGRIGIGTTSPWRTLSVNGSSDLGTNALAGYFTATTSTASTFPYASTTALTVSGTNGLQLATGLNGLLQAVNGLVQSSSTLSVAFGGTGLSTTPTYGQLLVGDGAGNYSLTGTSTLGIMASSAIGMGTQGFIPYYASAAQALTATSSLFISQDSFIGIGTTTPTSALSVFSASAPQFQLAYNKDNYLKTSVSSSGGVTMAVNGSLGGFAITNSQPTAVQTGTGTDAPLSFSVVGGIGGNSLDTNAAVGGVGGGIQLNAGVGGTVYLATVSETGGAGGTVTVNGGVGGNASAPSVDFMARVAGAGGALTFAGGTGGNASNGGFISSNTAGSGGTFTLKGGTGGNASGATTNNGGAGGSLYLSGGAGGTGSTLNGTAGNLYLGFDSLSSIGNVYFGNQNVSYIGSTGNFGIGTTSPYAKLSVFGANATVPTFALTGYYNQTSPLMLVASTTGSATSTAFIIDSNGKVGIGTTTPYTKLSVSGGVAGQYFNADSSTATSTFAGGLSVAGTSGLTVLQNGNVGVGTASPVITTGVSSNRKVLQIMGSDTYGSELRITTASQSIRFFNDNTKGGFGSDSNIPIRFFTNGGGNSYLEIATNGQVGIGTTSPYAKLSVFGANATVPTFALTGYYNQTSPLMLVASTTGSATSTAFIIDSNGLVGLGTNIPTHSLTLSSISSGLSLYNTSDQTTNYERGLLSWSSNILRLGSEKGGTGTARDINLQTPAAKLIIKGAAASPMIDYDINSSSAIQTFIRLTNGTIGNASTGINQSAVVITPSFNQTSTASWKGLLVNVTDNGSSTGLKYLQEWQLAGVSKMVINNIGNVGLGTTTPAWMLQVASSSASATMKGQLALTDTVAGTNLKHWLFSSMGGNLYIGTSSDAYATSTIAALTVDSNGLVGIGTTTPYTQLSVSGGVAGQYFNADSSTATSTFAGGLSVAGTSGLTVLQNGNVGVGTVAPVTPFMVKGAHVTGYGIGYFESTTADAMFTMRGGVSGSSSSGIRLQVNGSTPAEFFVRNVYSNQTLQFQNSAQLGVLNITQTSLVGIGTTSPYAKLSVTNTSATQPALAVYGFNSQTSPLMLVASTTGSATSTAFIIDSNGKVGIGTTSPYTQLSVQGGGAFDVLSVNSTTATSTIYGFLDVLGTGTNATSTFASNLWVKGGLKIGTNSVYLSDSGISYSSAFNTIYGSAATTTIPTNTNFAWTIATSSTATPIFQIDTTGNMATTTIGGIGAGNVTIGDATSPTNLLFGSSASILAGGNTITIGQAGDTFNFAVNLGIGSSTPYSALTVGSGNIGAFNGAICADNGGTAKCFATLTAGTVYGDASSFAASDLAENYSAGEPGLEAGDVVMLTDEFSDVELSKRNSDINYLRSKYGPNIPSQLMDSLNIGVVKASDRSKLLGVVSTQPGVLLGDTTGEELKTTIKPIALAGRVPVKVNNQGGAIKKGDFITLSTAKGIGMKATTTGRTIGIALEDFSGVSGKINVLVNLGSNVFDSNIALATTTIETTYVGSSTISSSVQTLADAIIALDLKVDALIASSTIDTDLVIASTTLALIKDSNFISEISSSTANVLSSNNSFVQSIANAVKNILSSAQDWVVDRFTAKVAYINRVEAETVAISKGMEIVDQISGAIWCVTIKNGDWNKIMGACASTATSTTPSPTPIVPIATPIPTISITPPLTPLATTTPIVETASSTGEISGGSVGPSIPIPVISPEVNPLPEATPALSTSSEVSPVPEASPVPSTSPETSLTPAPITSEPSVAPEVVSVPTEVVTTTP